MKIGRITYKSTEGCITGGIRYRVLVSDIPDYIKEKWMEYAKGICTDEEIANPMIEMEAVLLSDNTLEKDIEFKYYFDNYEYFDFYSADAEVLESLFIEYCKKYGDSYPDAYNPETGESMGDGEYSELVNKRINKKIPKIYAKDYAACIVDIFEDFLDKKGIKIPNLEKTGDEGEAIIYGDDFDYLQNKIIDTIRYLCEEAKVEVDTENWSSGMAEKIYENELNEIKELSDSIPPHTRDGSL